MNLCQSWPICKINVPSDGHCLFHAITMAIYKSYQDADAPGRLHMVIQLRHQLADQLENYYSTMNNGNMIELAASVPEFSLNEMQAELKSTASIGFGYFEFICNQINKDLIILEKDRIYWSDEVPLMIKGRTTIVLYYKKNHYTLVGLKEDTHFKSTHPWIVFLKKKLAEQIKKL